MMDERKKYGELFDAQLVILDKNGLDEDTCRRLADKKAKVIETALGLKIPDGDYPFIPNIGESLDWHLERLREWGKPVRIHSYIETVSDQIEVQPLSFTYGINDGYCVRYLTFEETKKKFEKTNVSPLIFKELVMYKILASQSETDFGCHVCDEVAALGSTISNKKGKLFIPDFYSDYHNEELITDSLFFSSKDGRSAPFCRKRV